jgi:NitT/TauT family transport system ATP-binding protein
MSAIEFTDVRRVFQLPSRTAVALDGISLRIAEQEFVAIVGPSGCGKTTCLRLAAGFDFPSSGAVTVGGRPVRGPGPERAVVFQHFALFPWMTVSANIMLGLRNCKLPKQECVERVADAIELMKLQGCENAFPHQLSGGMQQRVAIARAYVLEPEVLLMDEPFGALDAQTRVGMQEELVRLARVRPRTVLFITHAVEEAVYLADRVVVMTRNPGRIKEIISVKPIREREAWDRQERIEDVMNQPSFVQLRTEIWRLLRDEQRTSERSRKDGNTPGKENAA